MIAINATHNNQYSAVVYDIAARGVCPNCTGVSTVGTNIIAWLNDGAGEAEQALAQAVLTNANPVNITASKNSVTADGVDTVTITAPSQLPQCAYIVYAGVSEYARGNVSPVGGTITLEFSTTAQGQYRVFVISGTQSNFVNITAL